ncbi:hypothetical protein, partial [uncultured Chryseobacterium sp.]|uniref:hypothetical protein n=1 Tax=uncultured Chryseobacterium sp. TaxID=259322 RepID=UPI002635F92C
MKKTYFLLFLLFCSKIGFGQVNEGNYNIPNIFPSSPDTYQLGSYGNINIGEYTGTMQHDIPLFEYSVGDIKVPVTLQYSSNGVKVDDYNPIVGLGWSLSTGGVISKITRDNDDLNYDFHWQKYNEVDQGLKLNFFQQVIGLDKFDTEKDLFRINIPGIFSNTFIKKGDKFDNNEWLQEKKTDFKIEKSVDQNQNTSFIITSPQGIKYYFELLENSIFRTHGMGWTVPDVSLGSAYFLTKITDTKNNSVIIEYEPEILSYTSSSNEIYNFFDNSSNNITCQNDPTNNPTAGVAGYKKGSNLVRYETFRIKKIKNNINNHVIDFTYASKVNDVENRSMYLDEIKLSANGTIDFYKMDYLVTSNSRVFLQKVFSTISNKSYDLEYLNPYQLPKRLSNAQDFWGYYNGASNSSLIAKIDHPYLENQNFTFANREVNPTLSPSGLLSKIIYPTEGYTKITYEPHTEWGTKVIPSPLKHKYLSILTDEITSQKQVTTTFYSGKNQKIKFTGGAQYNQDCSFPMTHEPRVYLKVKNLSTGNNIPLQILTSYGYANTTNTYFYPGGTNIFYIDGEVGIQYEITLEVLRMCFGGGVDAEYFESPDTTIETNIPMGGNRVEKIEHFDNVSSNPVIEKWYYAHKDQLTKSSGYNFYKPVIWKISEGTGYCPPSSGSTPAIDYEYVPYRYVSIYSNSLIPLFGNENYNISYQYITKSIGGLNFEKGGKFTEYTIGIDPIASLLFGYGSYRGGNHTNSIWDKGLIKATEDIILSNSSLKVLTRTTNDYYYNQDKREEIESLIGVRYATPQMIQMLGYNCSATDVLAQQGYSPCYGKPVGYQIFYLPFYKLNMFGEVLRYKFVSHDYNLKTVTKREYFDNNTGLVNVENTTYGIQHFQPVSRELISSDNSTQETTYKYAHEKGNQLMISKNMIGIPLETETKQTING